MRSFHLKNVKIISIFFILIFTFHSVFSLEEVSINQENQNLTNSKDKLEYFGDTQKYVLVERTDLRRYDNGKYTGLTSREVRSFVNPIAAPKNVASEYLNNSWFSGNFMVFEATKNGFVGGPMYASKAPKIIQRDFEPGARIAVHRKDIINATDHAKRLGIDLPMTNMVLDVMNWMDETGRINEDQSALIQYFESAMGIQMPQERKDGSV